MILVWASERPKQAKRKMRHKNQFLKDMEAQFDFAIRLYEGEKLTKIRGMMTRIYER